MGRDMGPTIEDIEKYKHLSFGLWKILDDIDTLSDICKSDNEMYRAKVEKIQKLRFILCDKQTVDYLYERYYVAPEKPQ